MSACDTDGGCLRVNGVVVDAAITDSVGGVVVVLRPDEVPMDFALPLLAPASGTAGPPRATGGGALGSERCCVAPTFLTPRAVRLGEATARMTFCCYARRHRRAPPPPGI
jgi:hypothetical protein